MGNAQPTINGFQNLLKQFLNPNQTQQAGSPQLPAASPMGPFKGLLQPGNIDLNNRPLVKNPDGSISTVESSSYRNAKGQEVLIPTISEEGKHMTMPEARKYWGQKGQYLGIFDNPANADTYAQQLHLAQERHYLGNQQPLLTQGGSQGGWGNQGQNFVSQDERSSLADRMGFPVAQPTAKPQQTTVQPTMTGTAANLGKTYDEGSIPDSYYASIRAAESGGNDNAKNPLSSAAGRYQFTAGTWGAVAKQHPELSLTPDGRFDPNQQERAIRAFTQDNARVLQANGIPLSGGSLYAAHFLGVGGATHVYKQPDNAMMRDVVGPGVVAANGFLSGMTVGQFKNWAAKKGGGGGAAGGGSSSSSSPATTGGFNPSGEANTALNTPTEKQASGGGGAPHGGTGPDSGGGGGAHKNSVSPDFKRYQARKSTSHLRSLGPVATIQALENIGKGLRAENSPHA